ncbi:MAG: hypothetical protein A3E78_13760 [Alphaproteobacteria bacterium RIFCSPHIGHO2_12_FULL_63_12]|nr:MAG: hypothetical protein A3E78_13760 [Alphaproteobacteria bacterium RIFCSPHIGHO2_12_FULL_63_12]
MRAFTAANPELLLPGTSLAEMTPEDRKGTYLRTLVKAVPLLKWRRIVKAQVERAIGSPSKAPSLDAAKWLGTMLVGDLALAEGQAGPAAEEKRIMLSAVLASGPGKKLAADFARMLTKKGATA